MGAAQIGRHEVRVVEVGQRRFGVRRARVQNGLGEGFQLREVGVPRRRREGVVDEADGIAENRSSIAPICAASTPCAWRR